MSLLLPRVAARLFDTPLMVSPGKLAAMMQGIGARIAEGGVLVIADLEPLDHRAFANGRLLAGTVGDRLGRAYDARGVPTFDVVQGVAIIPVEGSLVHKGSFVGSSSGETSYEGLQTQVARAEREPGIRGVVFEVDSCGGEVAGVFETAEMISRLSRAKPTMAILTEAAYSSAYLLAAATRQIVVPKTGGTGSIGVVAMHRSLTKALDQAGIEVTLIFSGAHKVDGHPALPLGSDAREKLQGQVDAVREMFADAVGRYRGARLTKAKALATEAATFMGEDGVRAGLADVCAPANDAFAAFVRAVNQAA